MIGDDNIQGYLCRFRRLALYVPLVSGIFTNNKIVKTIQSDIQP